MTKFVTLSLLCLSAAYALAAPQPAGLSQLAELTPSTRTSQDWFGNSLAISGNTAVVAAFDPNIEQYGAVYIYVKGANGWQDMTQVATLTSSDNGEGFGETVAITGNTVVVGAFNPSNFSSHSSSTPSPGAAYVFVMPVSGWHDMTESAKLTASDGQPGDGFGSGVSISGNTIAVGAIFASTIFGQDGKAYVFVRPGGGWSGNLNESAELRASDTLPVSYFGASVGISGNTIIVGAYGHNNFQGAAYVFVKPANGWSGGLTQTAELTASDGSGSADFGFSGFISGNTIVIGAPNAHNSKGAGYVFVEPQTGWTNATQSAELVQPKVMQFFGFGQSVGISGNAVVIGAPGTTVGGNLGQGAAYVFIKPATGWKNSSRGLQLVASDGASFDGFGVSSAISRSTIVVGAPKSTSPGSAYVFGP